MKKIFLIILLLVSCSAAIYAGQLSQSQQKLKTEIFNALKKYGTNLTDAGDGTVMFKVNDIQYFVDVWEDEKDPMCVSIGAVFNLADKYNLYIAQRAAIEAASGMPVFCDADDGVLMFDCEMYLKESKPFIAVLPAMINAIQKSVSNFGDAYDKMEKEMVGTIPIASRGQMTKSLKTSNEFVFPTFTSSCKDRLYITKVTMGKEYTILEITSYNGGEYQNAAIDRNSYIMANGKKYTLIKADGITYAPVMTDYPGYETGGDVSLSFKLYFQPLPENTKTFDFYERGTEGWWIKGVKLSGAEMYALTSERISTQYNEWECIGIQLQDGQTVLTKRVSPKDDSTLVYSSQDAFIEDADTGRKYYLTTSEIGFEGSPKILLSRTPIEFHEVYPKLPSTVKRINISTGSQYFIKGLQIR